MENQSEEQSTAESITKYASLLWHRSWLLILLAALAGGIAYYLTSRQTPVYQATATVMINVASSAQDVNTSLYTAQMVKQSYLDLMTTRKVLDLVSQRLGLGDLSKAVQVSSEANTQLLTVTVTYTDPERAASIANMVVTVFNEQIQADQVARYADAKQNLKTQMDALFQQIQTTSSDLAVLGQEIQNDNTTLTGLLTPDNVKRTQAELDQRASLIKQTQSTLQSKLSQQAQSQIVLQNSQDSYSILLQSYESIRLAEAQSSSGVLLKDPAVPSEAPIRPRPIRSTILAAVAGLFLGAGIIYLIEFLDDSLRDPQEITRKWDIPILGMISTFDTSNGSELITEKQPRAPVSEAFRSLRTKLQFASIASPIHTLLVTSPCPEEGKSTIVGNLACVFAQDGRKVIVVDADLRRPRMHKIFQLQNRLGLADQFIHQMEYIEGAIHPTEVENLYVLTSGSLPTNPSELLGSQKMVEIVQTLKTQYDLIVLDAPPALVVTDASVLANYADGVLLVISPNLTKRAAIKDTIEQFAQAHANIVGVVFTRVEAKKAPYNKYGRRYASYLKPEPAGIGKLKSLKASNRENPLPPELKNPSDQQENNP